MFLAQLGQVAQQMHPAALMGAAVDVVAAVEVTDQVAAERLDVYKRQTTANSTMICRSIRISPTAWPTTSRMSGRMTTDDNCSATRGSLTRDETMTATQAASRVSSGATTSTANSQWMAKKALKTAGGASRRAPTRKMAKASHVARMAGTMAATILAVSSSTVVIGVASSGSRLRVVFSPTML